MEATERDILEVEIDFKDGKRTIDMVLKHTSEIVDCEEGKIVCLRIIGGRFNTGIFKGMDGDNIVLSSLSGKSTIGIQQKVVRAYLEQIDTE